MQKSAPRQPRGSDRNKAPTIREVAKYAKVSVATVSRVMNNLPNVSESSREAVLKAQKVLGYRPNATARALAQRESRNVGIVVSDVSDPFFGAVVRSCEETISGAGLTMLVSQGYHDVERERRAIDALLAHQCRGMVVHALVMSDAELASYMKRIPYMVLINRTLEGFESRCFNCDNRKGEFLAVEELIRCGHRKIAYVGSCHKILDSSERLAGYKDALQHYGIDFSSELCFEGEPSLEGGVAAAKILAESKVAGKDFTAVACYSDVMAAGVMSELHSRGLVCPHDVSITGFDNLDLSRCLIPRLTTVSNPVSQMSRNAVLCSVALNEQDEDYEGEEVLLDVSLVRRESVKDLNL